MNTTRASHWSLTINNPTPKTEEEIALARQKGWQVIGQKELGEEGTPHYQLVVKTPQVRFSALKKSFSTAHIEVSRNPVAAEQYVSKETTRVGELPKAQEKYPSLSRYWDLVYGYIAEHNLVLVSPDGTLRWRYKEDNTVPEPLNVLDDATRALIRQGYYVEGIACNPSTRSGFKNFGLALLDRHKMSLRETARQTDTALEEAETVTIPITNADDIEEREGSSPIQEDDEEDDEDEEGGSDESPYTSDQEGDCE